MPLLLIAACRPVTQQQIDPCNGPENEYYSAAEIDDVLCGYSIDRECLIMEEGKEVLLQTSLVSIKLSVLGQGIDIDINMQYKLDPITRKWFFNKSEFKTGGTVVLVSTEIRGDTAYFFENKGKQQIKVPVTADVQLESSVSFPHLVRDFIAANAEDASYKVYDIFNGQIIEKKYRKTGEEDLLLNDTIIHTIVLEETNLFTGTKAKIWLDAQTGFQLKTFVSGRTIYLTDKSVVGRITKVDYDNVIFARVNQVIPDFQQLTYMKVKARIESPGELLTVESLNRPGQKFTGSITDNVLEGEFELEPSRYDGANAPPFPPDFAGNTELKKYLEPERLIESDDPALVKEARRITEGSKDSWDAARRLSKWVSENIEGAIPGGTTAIDTYKTRQGECGSHSRLLAAFCRAVGIPARLSIGCAYTTHYYGSFGQHAWNEIYMGEAGWIPVDATFSETDYIDAGHIRLGETARFMPKGMEILEYRIGKGRNIPGNSTSLIDTILR